MLTLGYANGIWRPPLIKIGVKIMDCKHTEVVECDCGECLGCPIGSRGDMCAACGMEVMNDEGDSNE